MKVLVTGAAGQVGREVLAALDTREHDVVACNHATLDVRDATGATRLITDTRPDAIVHCAAFTAVDRCELARARAFAVNDVGTANVVSAARAAGAHVVALSTDYVFDGTAPHPYVEADEPNPLSAYGASKLAGERRVGADNAVVRTSWVCGRTGSNMVRTILRLAAEHEKLAFVTDQRAHPTIASDLASMLVRFVEERRTGLWHVTNQGAVSWYEFAQEVLRAAGHDPTRVQPITTAELRPPRPAPRPANSVLANARVAAERMPLLRDFRDALPTLLRELA
ncbi:MAG: dTDP-4-dehydrorhamnose reductase [Actinomycetota bacterium]